MIPDEHVETLMGFGLTFLQAKTYLALAKLGKADVKTIAKASNVARQDIYRIMPTLQTKDLVEKIVAAPTEYRAIPIQDGLSILLKNKVQEYEEIEKKTKELLDRLKENHREEAAKEYEITLLTAKNAAIRRQKQD